jgi:hypothetical protein
MEEERATAVAAVYEIATRIVEMVLADLDLSRRPQNV